MKLGTRARTVLLVLVWHTFVQPLGRVRRASKGILHTKENGSKTKKWMHNTEKADFHVFACIKWGVVENRVESGLRLDILKPN